MQVLFYERSREISISSKVYPLVHSRIPQTCERKSKNSVNIEPIRIESLATEGRIRVRTDMKAILGKFL